MLYFVTFKIEGRFVTAVHAQNLEKAKRKAIYKYEDADFGELNDIEGEVIMVEDNKGNYLYEK